MSRLPLAATFLISAIGFFWMALLAKVLKLREKPPTSRAWLSMEERRRKVRIGMWIAIACACLSVLGAVYFALISDSEY